jgi:long-chain acyl-CoA synthetase
VFQTLGLQKGDRLGILAPTCLEWELTHMATMATGGILVGLEPHDVAERLQRIASQVDINALLVQDCTLLGKLPTALLRPCKFIITLEPDPEPQPGLPLVSWQSLMPTSPPSLAAPEALPEPAAPATVIYTSGTTGNPKGILYSHQQVALACASIVRAFPHVQAGSRFICWLPLSNLFQRIMNLCAMAIGGTTYLVGDPLKVLEAIRVVEPDIFIGVPRFYEKLYAGLHKEIARKPVWMQKLIYSAIAIGGRYVTHLREGRTPSRALQTAQKLSDHLVLLHLRKVMGSRLQFMISGSAPLPVWLLEFCHAIGLLILEAYGLSENVVPIAMNRPDAFRFGSVGQMLDGNDIRIGSEGEVMVRGPGLFSGYHKDTKDTQALTRFTPDGFYLTGDYAVIDDAGFLHLKGRSSDLIKTSGGRRIAPVGIEAKLRQVPYIDQVMVLGTGRKCLVGLLTLDWEMLEARVKDANYTAGTNDVRSALMDDLIVAALKSVLAQLPRYEQPAGFLILRRGFSIDGGELTSNLKLRRGAIETKYVSHIDKLYDDIDRLDDAAAGSRVSPRALLVRYV